MTLDAAPPPAPPADLPRKKAHPHYQDPRGIGGWLVLVAIGLVITPLRTAWLLVSVHAPIFTGDTWSILTTPGSEPYHPLWGPLLVFETVGNLLLLGLSGLLLFLFFGEKRSFPRWMIAFLALNVLFVGLDNVVGNLIPAVAAQPDPESTRELVRAFIGCAIWVPYFLVSRRVKATFVN